MTETIRYSEDDRRFMALALEEAHAARAAGDYPVGATLVVNGELWATDRNALFSQARTTAHAEHTVIYRQSMRLRDRLLSEPDAKICLYTTLEPCLMCLGIAVLHRVSRIVSACPDPNGGTTNLDISTLGSVYRRWWPECHTGLYRHESCTLIIQFLQTKTFRSWESMLTEFQTMQEDWSVTAPHAEEPARC